MIIKPWLIFDQEPTNPHEDYHLPPRIIYHYTSFDTAKKIIEGHKLKFSRPSTFNDPFDMYEGLIDFTPHGREFRAWIKNNIPVSRNFRRELERVGINNPDAPSAFQSGLTKLRNEAGVCCFSKIPDHTLMWSHYADRHKGICLGFNIQPILENEDFIVFEVNYPEVIETVNFFKDKDKTLRHWAFTKMKAWEYEKEVRAVIRNTKFQSLFEFDKACLKEIIFGYSSKENDIVEIDKLTSDNGYQISSKKKMIIDHHCFELKAVDL